MTGRRHDVSVPPLELPRNLVAASDDEANLSLSRWMTDLPDLVADLASRWSLDLGRPFQPGGTASWAAPARTATGTDVVLKVGFPHDEALHEADGLRAWDGHGVVRLLESLTLGETVALLLEVCRPGTTLALAMPPAAQDVVIADLLRRLWIAPPIGHPFRALQTMCDSWVDGFERRRAASDRRTDPGLARVGTELFRSLPRSAQRSTLLCTDLHADNVLAAEREPWLVIDPKPYVGDPTYDALQHMLNHPERLATDAVDFVRRMADLLDLDPERLQQWLFARCVIESVTQPHLEQVATALRI